MYKKTIGYKFRSLRFKKNISQEQVSKAIGIKLETISRIENKSETVREQTKKT
ncbi:helix-turn-helix domain-containing protein [Mesobacillus harenae]|uniref:helix-turn-helix domain-containing protein n=1 Tax=Mesobacillus harenae TaxID=2213203 RepID=UPI00158037E0